MKNIAKIIIFNIIYNHRLKLPVSRTVSLIGSLSAILVIALFCSDCALGGYAEPGVYEPPEEYFGDTFILIDFDYDPAGELIPDNTSISNQYQSKGAIFTPTDSSPESQWMAVHHSSDYGFGHDWISYPNTLASDHTDSLSTPIIVRVIFPPDMFVSMPTRVGIVFTDSCWDNPFTMQAFDSFGQIVDSITIDTADYTPWSSDHLEDTFCGVEYAGGIYRIEFGTQYKDNGSITGMEVDNLYHNGVLIPEPITLGILGFGGLVLLRRHKP